VLILNLQLIQEVAWTSLIKASKILLLEKLVHLVPAILTPEERLHLVVLFLRGLFF